MRHFSSDWDEIEPSETTDAPYFLPGPEEFSLFLKRIKAVKRAKEKSHVTL